MKNAAAMRDEMQKVYDLMKSGEMPVKLGDSLANVAGKMVSSAKVQVAYYALRKETPQIDWLKDDS